MKVFESSSFANLTVKNRIFRSATHEGLGEDNGFQQDKLRDRYVRLANGGVGAIITGYAGVSMDGKAWPNMMMIDKDECIPAFQSVTSAVKPHGTPLILQIAHGGGRTKPEVTGAETRAPSKHRYKGASSIARELTDSEVDAIIGYFVKAIVRAKQSGFDGVQIHAAHGYLLSEFLSPVLNQRKDRWGGTTEKRFRIIREIVVQARELVGRYPILIKFSAYDFEKDGMRLEEGIQIAQLCQEASVDAIEVSCGTDDWFCTVRSPKIPVDAILAMESNLKNASWIRKRMAAFLIPMLFTTYNEIENYNVYAAEKIKANVNIPIIVVGGVRRLSAITEIIGQDKADYVSMCRPFIIEPEIVDKMRTGKQDDSRCINCNYCLIGVGSNPLRCYYGKVPG